MDSSLFTFDQVIMNLDKILVIFKKKSETDEEKQIITVMYENTPITTTFEGDIESNNLLFESLKNAWNKNQVEKRKKESFFSFCCGS